MSRTYSKMKDKQNYKSPKVNYHQYLDHPSEPRDDAVYGIMPDFEEALMENVASLKQRIRHLARKKRNRYFVK